MCITLKINICILLLFLPFCGLVGWFSYNVANLGNGCYPQKCNYIDNGLFKCNVSVIGNSNFNCTHQFPCPKNENTTCYIYEDNQCPLVALCVNKYYSTQSIIIGIAGVLLLVGIVVFIVYENRKSAYVVVG